MQPPAAPGRLLVIVGIALAWGCSPSRGAGAGPTPTPLALSRCAEASGILCVVTFGMMPANQMLVAMNAPVGGLSDLHLRISHLGTSFIFPCAAAPDYPNSFNCTGPQIPLGSTIRIEVLTERADTVLARGDFFLAGFAVPSAQFETPPPPGTAYPNP